MANKPLKSINYPGLPNTYTFTQLTTDLTEAGKAADAKVVGDEIEGVKEDLMLISEHVEETNSDFYIYGKNVFPNNVIWLPATINTSGQVVGKLDSNTSEEEFIPVTPEESWTLSWKAKDLNCSMYIYGYDANKTFISQIASAVMNSVTRSVTITTPANCAFIRLRVYRNMATYTDIIPEEMQVERGTVATSYEPYYKTSRFTVVDAEIDAIQEELDNKPLRPVISDINLLENLITGYLTNEGTFNTTTSGWRRSDYIPVEPNQFVYFCDINNYNFFGYFNEAKEWIGGRDLETPSVTDSSRLCVHKVPDNTNIRYMIVSLEDTKVSTCWGNYTPTIPTGKIIDANTDIVRSYEYFPSNPCDYEGMDVCAFRKGICIGDSITGGGFNYSSGTNPWRDGNVYSYPSKFSKMTGIEMTNEGHSGKTTVQWWNIYGTGGEQEIDFTGYDFAIIHLGINDVSYSVNLEDTETAYQNIINALKTANTGIKIFVCTIIPAYADALVSESSYGDVNDLISSFADQENVYLCDLTTYGHEYINSEYAAGHLTAYGYWRLAKDLIAYIGYIMRSKPAEFRFIQYIGTDMQYS